MITVWPLNTARQSVQPHYLHYNFALKAMHVWDEVVKTFSVKWHVCFNLKWLDSLGWSTIFYDADVSYTKLHVWSATFFPMTTFREIKVWWQSHKIHNMLSRDTEANQTKCVTSCSVLDLTYTLQQNSKKWNRASRKRENHRKVATTMG